MPDGVRPMTPSPLGHATITARAGCSGSIKMKLWVTPARDGTVITVSRASAAVRVAAPIRATPIKATGTKRHHMPGSAAVQHGTDPVGHRRGCFVLDAEEAVRCEGLAGVGL